MRTSVRFGHAHHGTARARIALHLSAEGLDAVQRLELHLHRRREWSAAIEHLRANAWR
jgi:hypothetical protein